MQRVLQFSLVATFVYVLLTFFAGLRGHSLALISEAGHNVSDMLALLLSFVAVYFQSRPATERKTFGYQRAGVLAAFVNALTLVVISVWIVFAAIHRLTSPVVVHPRVMMMVAAVGVLMNGVIAALLWKFSRDVNIRSVFVHMLGDTLSTATVIAGGAGILFTGMAWIDPALSILIAAMILWSSIAIVRETLNILLEGTPLDLDVSEIRASMQSTEGVLDVHDLHVWSLGSHSHALASHVTIEDVPLSASAAILDRLKCALRDKFRIHHTTIQFEITGCETTHGCSAPPEAVAVGAHGHHHHGHGHSH
ncbi:MAG: cation diffusion facilitator family transporter [Acidobacteriaceae bacterium]